MRGWSQFEALFSLLLLAALATPAPAGTTGGIVGLVRDSSGLALPGATVTARSSALQGERTATTDRSGGYRFSALPPGNYTISAELAGFVAVRRERISVGIDSTPGVDFTLHPAASAEISVQDTAPLLDTTSTAGGVNFTEELFESLPLGRNYSTVVTRTPGTSSDGAGIAFYGSTGAENQWIVDGVDTTNIAFGTQGKNLNFDFIKEIEVKNSGYEAEFGRATGGIINVITKSGGNQLHGDGFTYWTGSALQAESCSTCGTRTGRTGSNDTYELGGDLGGFILRDRLWFFGALNPIRNLSTGYAPDHANSLALDRYLPDAPGAEYENSSWSHYFAGKLTWNASGSVNLVAAAFGDPSSGTSRAPLGDDKADIRNESGGADYTLKVNAVLNPSLYLDAQAALHQESSRTLPEDGDLESPIYYHRSSTISYNGFGSYTNRSLDRPQLRAAFTAFSGEHEVKFGVEYLRAIYEDVRGFTGGAFWSIRDDTVRSARFFQGFDADGNPLIQDRFEARTTTSTMSAYAQDKWNINDNLLLSAGLRWERLQGQDYAGKTRLELDSNLAPRLGVVWMPDGKRRWKVYASAGRFYEAIPLDLNNRALGAEGFRYDYYSRVTRDPDIAFGRADIGGWQRYLTLGGAITPVANDLKGQHLDEATLGVEWQAADGLVIATKLIGQRIGDVIEDVSVDDGAHYFIGNPGQGQAAVGIDSNGNAVAFPLPERRYRGIELSVHRRFANRWQVFASWIYGRHEGNYEGLFSSNNGQLDPNITSAFDIPTLLPNRYGPLHNDRRHTLKIDGSWETPFLLSIGASFRLTAGEPLSTLGAHPVYGGDEAFILPRGQVFDQSVIDSVWRDQGLEASSGRPAPESRDRDGTAAQLDLSLQFPVRLAATTLTLYADVFNILNDQRTVDYQNTYTGDSVDVQSLAGLPQEQIALKYKASPDYLRATGYQSPRSARLGAKLSF